VSANLAPSAEAAPRALAGTDPSSPPAGAPDPVPDPVPGPVPELANANSSTVRNADGSYTTEVSSGLVNFQDESGSWLPISNELVEAPGSAYAVENEANSYRVAIPENPAVTPVRFESEGAWLTMKLVGSEDVEAEVEGSEASFEDMVPSADEISYQATDAGVKETITLAEAPRGSVSYAYTLKVSPGTTPVLTAGGRVEFRDEAGVAQFVIPVGTMTDSAAPEPAWSSDVTYQLRPEGAGWRFTITPSRAWLTDPARVYPVQVDPTVDKITQKDCWLEEENPNANHCGDWVVLAGNNNNLKRRRGLFDFNINNIPHGAVLNNATAWMWVDSVNSAGSGTGTSYALFNPTQNWSGGATWNNAVGGVAQNGWVVPWVGGGNGGQISTSSVLKGDTSGWAAFEMTGRVQGWVNGGYENKGVLLRQVNENTKRVIAIISSDYPTAGYRPLLRVDWTDRAPTVGAPSLSPPTANLTTTNNAPTFSATVSDPEGTDVAGCFWVWDASWTTNLWSQCSSWVHSNQITSVTMPRGIISVGGTYNVQALGADGVNWSSNWTYLTFTVDRPAPPECQPMLSECAGEGCDLDSDVNCADGDVSARRAGVPQTVNRYAPYIVLHADEPYDPMSAGSFIDRSRLVWSHDSGCGDYTWPDDPPVAAWLNESGAYTWHTASNVLCNSESSFWDPYQDVWPHSHSSAGPGGGEGLYLEADDDTKDGGGFAGDENVYYKYTPFQQIDYWFFYGYSKTLQVGAHEGDWEHIAVRLNANNTATDFAFYHHTDVCKLSYAATPKYQYRPWVHVARSSHGSYPKGADGQNGDNIVEEEPRNKWNARPNLYDLNDMVWYPYGGGWGHYRGVSDKVSGPQGPSNYKPLPLDWNHTHSCDMNG
jgi:hypothetical protein